MGDPQTSTGLNAHLRFPLAPRLWMLLLLPLPLRPLLLQLSSFGIQTAARFGRCEQWQGWCGYVEVVVCSASIWSLT